MLLGKASSPGEPIASWGPIPSHTSFGKLFNLLNCDPFSCKTGLVIAILWDAVEKAGIRFALGMPQSFSLHMNLSVLPK